MTAQAQHSLVRPRHIVLIVFLLGTTIVTGVIHGRLTQRWGPVPDLVAATQHLAEFPKQFGDWQLLSDSPLEESTVRMLSCAGYVNRQYVNRKTGKAVSVALMLGPSGPIAVHTPEICYSSRAYTVAIPRERISLADSAGKSQTFWSLSFRSGKPSTDQLHVCYAWNGNGEWVASSSPRFEFAAKRMLLKLQIASLVPSMSHAQAPPAADPCQDFLTAMLSDGWSISG